MRFMRVFSFLFGVLFLGRFCFWRVLCSWVEESAADKVVFGTCSREEGRED